MNLTALDDEQQAQLQAWRAIALDEMPYFASILFACRVVNAPGLGTWAVDKHYRMYIDFDAVAKKSFRWNVESVLHEASHLFADHATSAEDLGITKATHQVWNVAADLSINDDLDECGHKTFRVDKMLPEFIGEPNGQTPHHYFAVLQRKMAAAAHNQTKAAPKLILDPAKVAEGKVAGLVVTAKVKPAFMDPNNFTFTLTDLDGTDVALAAVTPHSANGLSFTIVDELPLGAYVATIISGGVTVSAPLNVGAPSIKVSPDHIERGYVAPEPVQIIGTLTNFSVNAIVTLTDEAGTRVPVAAVQQTSPTEVEFEIPTQVPDGLYTVTVIDGHDQYAALLPIGLPHMQLNPANLLPNYTAPASIEALAADFTFDATTTFEIAMAGGAVSLAVFNASVTGPTHADLGLSVLMSPGEYTVVATTGTDQAAATLSIADPKDGDGDTDGDGGSGGEGKGEGTGSGEGDPYKGCGSGSGGEAWAGELDPSDDLDGIAPPIGDIEKESIRLATAAAMKDYVAKGRGTVPGGLMAVADKVLAPSKTPWQTLLAAAVRRAAGRQRGPSKADHNRRDRRRHAQTVLTARGPRKVIVAGRYKPIPKMVVIRDTSGSMGAYDLAMVNREIVSIAKHMGIKGDNLIVMDVDAAVHSVKKFKNQESLNEVAGRGGTSMTVGIQHVWDSPELPNVIVVLTDGGTDWPPAPGPVPIVAAIVPQGDGSYAEHWTKNVPDFIRAIVVEPAQARLGT